MSHFEPKAEDPNCAGFYELNVVHEYSNFYSPNFLESNKYSFEKIDSEEIDINHSYRYTSQIGKNKSSSPFCQLDKKIQKKKPTRINPTTKLGYAPVQ